MKIKQGDMVTIITGKEKGKQGKVLKTLQGQVVVEKRALVTRHIKKTAEKEGGIIRKEAPIDVSNIKLVCPECGKNVRVGYEVPETGKKYRICKKCKKTIDKQIITKK